MTFSDQFRTGIQDYFSQSGVMGYSELKHTPFVVFNGKSVELCFNAKSLIENYKPNTDVIGQWTGKWRSDFFKFKVKDVIEYFNRSKQIVN